MYFIKGSCDEFNLRAVAFAAAGGHLCGNAGQPAEAWRAGVVSNEDVALEETFYGHTLSEQTPAQLSYFPAYVNVNVTVLSTTLKCLALLWTLLLAGRVPGHSLVHANVLRVKRKYQIIQKEGSANAGNRDRKQLKERIPETHKMAGKYRSPENRHWSNVCRGTKINSAWRWGCSYVDTHRYTQSTAFIFRKFRKCVSFSKSGLTSISNHLPILAFIRQQLIK